MTDASTASSTKMPTIWFFFLALPVKIGCIHSSPSNTILGGYMLACLYTHSFVRSLARSHASSSSINGLAFFSSLSPPPYCAAHLFLFSFQPISVRCCRRRSFSNARLDYRGVWRNKQTNSERSEKEREKKHGFFSTLSRSRARAVSLIFSFSPNTTYEAGIHRFVSHSLAHIFKHRRRRPSSFMSFLLSPFFLFFVRLVVIE